MLRFADSCDTYAIGQMGLKWTETYGAYLSLVSGRYGNGVRIADAGVTNTGFRKAVPSGPTWYIGFAYKVNIFKASAFVLRLRHIVGTTPTTHLVLATNLSGYIEIHRGTVGTSPLAVSTNPLIAGTWNFIEFGTTIGDTPDGMIEVRVDGTSNGWIEPLTGIDTRNAGSIPAVTDVVFGTGPSLSGLTNAADFDDVYICDDVPDSTPGVNHQCIGFLGDCRVLATFPDANGSLRQWTPSQGSDDYPLVDEAALVVDPGTDDYLSSSTTDQRTTFAFPALPYASGEVQAVQINMAVRKDDAGSRTVDSVVYEGVSTHDTGSPVALSDSYVYASHVLETNPGNPGEAWTIDDINNSEFGIKLVS